MSFPHVSEADPLCVPAEPAQTEPGSPFLSPPSAADIRGTWLGLSLDAVSAGDFICTFLLFFIFFLAVLCTFELCFKQRGARSPARDGLGCIPVPGDGDSTLSLTSSLQTPPEQTLHSAPEFLPQPLVCCLEQVASTCQRGSVLGVVFGVSCVQPTFLLCPPASPSGPAGPGPPSSEVCGHIHALLVENKPLESGVSVGQACPGLLPAPPREWGKSSWGRT